MLEYTIIKLNKQYKITRRNPEYSITETIMPSTKEEILKQLNKWL